MHFAFQGSGALALDLTRRELLTTFLGVPIAAAACRRRAPRLPPGDLVGASHELGHRLRPNGPPPRPSRWESHDVVIAGGGIAGLAAAWRLGAAGVRDVVLFDLEPVLGGTSRSSATYPWGAHYIVAPSPENRVLTRLLGEMGVLEEGAVAEQFLCRDPAERLHYRGRWYEGLYLYAGATAEDLRQLRAFEAEMARWAAWRDGRGLAAFAIPMALASDDAEVTALDAMSMGEWLDSRGFISPRLRWLVEYGCRDDYGTLLGDTSAWAAIFYYASREQRPVVTWPEGNGRIVSHLASSARARTGWLVADIAPTENGADVIALRGDEAVGIHARRVIFAGPQFVAARVLAPWRDNPPPHIREFTYGSWLVANLSLRDRPVSHGFPLAWDNVIYDSPSLGYVVSTHQRGIEHGPTVLTYYYPLCDTNVRTARERLLSAGRDQWAEIALADLSRAHQDIRSLTGRIDIMRWGHAMIRPTPRFVWSPARREAAKPYRSVHFANTDLSAVALCEEALDHGVRAAEEVLVAMNILDPPWR
ncbi:MAG TPA: FAD-dependent oxidoreductase [Thermoanaerobaculia bacterium]|nr:FAD-dependent oxidoreductase [Thermoanaerobaculia bacterium]